MRSRLIAVIILFVFIGWPTYLYWFYYKKNITSLVFISKENDTYTVELDGELKYKNFPLLDQVFRYKSTCTGSCYFSPIPPINYSLRISSNGREDIVDEITLKNGEEKKYLVKLPIVFLTKKIWEFQENLPKMLNNGYFSIGTSSENQTIAILDKRDWGELGYTSSWNFIVLFRSSESLLNAYLDATRSYVIVPNILSKQSLYPIKSNGLWVTFPYSENVISVSEIDGGLKVQTTKWLYENRNNQWKYNPRFTDYIDYNSRYRIWFINKMQYEKFQLQNITEGLSVLVLYDRETSVLSMLKRGIDIQGFLFHEGRPCFIDTAWDIYEVELHWI